MIGSVAVATALPDGVGWMDLLLDPLRTRPSRSLVLRHQHCCATRPPARGCPRRTEQLAVDHVAAMFDTIAERNDEIEAARASADSQIRTSVKGLRPTGPATMQHYRATLRAALDAAIRAKKITFNAASHVELRPVINARALGELPAASGADLLIHVAQMVPTVLTRQLHGRRRARGPGQRRRRRSATRRGRGPTDG